MLDDKIIYHVAARSLFFLFLLYFWVFLNLFSVNVQFEIALLARQVLGVAVKNISLFIFDDENSNLLFFNWIDRNVGLTR